MPRRRQVGPTQIVEITTVDMVRRQVEARLKDGGIIVLAIMNIPTLFRWPKVGEYWMVRKEGGQWTLVESTDPSVTMRSGDDPYEKAIRVEDMNEGEVRLIATPNKQGSGVWINKHQAARKVVFMAGENDSFTLNHELGTEHINISLFQEEGQSLDYPQITVTGPNTVLLEFSEILPKDALRVIITG